MVYGYEHEIHSSKLEEDLECQMNEWIDLDSF